MGYHLPLEADEIFDKIELGERYFNCHRKGKRE